ncbi:MAG: chemotaxis protein CheW [Janthinobacterium lividum]
MPDKQPAPTAPALHPVSSQAPHPAQAPAVEATAAATHVSTTTLADRLRMAQVADCWKRIGVRGDRSCPVLREVIHCRNCPVFATAAAALLDRPLSADDLASAAQERAAANASIGSITRTVAASRSTANTNVIGSASEYGIAKQSYLIFCIEDEWLAFPTAEFRQVAELRGMHTLPHRRHEALLGLVNVRGALTLLIDLAKLLGIPRATQNNAEAPPPHAGVDASAQQTATREREAWARRLLVIGRSRQTAAFAVRAVGGVQRVTQAELLPVPATIRQARQAGGAPDAREAFTRGLISWQGHSVGLLDSDAVFAALSQSLT